MESLTIGQIVAAVVICQTLMTFIEKMVDKITKPHSDLEKKINNQDERIEKFETEMINMNEKLEKLSKDNHMIMKTILDMMEHMLTGNHQEAMKQTMKDLQSYLVEKN